MATLAADKSRKFESDHDVMLNELPMIASDIIYLGAAVGESGSDGTYRPLVAGDNFAGFCTEKCDNSTGAASAKSVKVVSQGVVTLAVTGVTSEADKDLPVYASDDDTFTLTATSNTPIGKVFRWTTGTTCQVYFRAHGLLGLSATGAGTSAYTQTYATADRTHANPTATALTHSAVGGTADGTLVDCTSSYSEAAVEENFKECATAINALIVDLADLKQLVNGIIDDMQAQGFAR